MSDFRTWLLRWNDGGVTELLTNACLRSGVCYDGAWLRLDAKMLAEFGRIHFCEKPAKSLKP